MIVYCCWFTTYCLWMYKTSENSIWIPMLHLFQYEAIHHFHCVPNHVAAIVNIFRYDDISDYIDNNGMDFVCWVSGCQTPDWGTCTKIYNGTIPSNFTFSEPVYLEKRFPWIVWWDSILHHYNLTSVSGNVCFLIRIWGTICTNLMHKRPSNTKFQECLAPPAAFKCIIDNQYALSISNTVHQTRQSLQDRQSRQTAVPFWEDNEKKFEVCESNVDK